MYEFCKLETASIHRLHPVSRRFLPVLLSVHLELVSKRQ